MKIGNLCISNPVFLAPMAGITGITVKNKGELGSIREAEVKWVCWDEGQFDTLQRLFMTPGISCLLEWGWSLKSDGNIVIMESSFFDFELNPTKLVKLVPPLNFYYPFEF